MALAAAIRAGGGALVFRITPTRTFSAVLVWLRAIERISVMVLAIVAIMPAVANELNKLCAHDNPCHNAMAIK